MTMYTGVISAETAKQIEEANKQHRKQRHSDFLHKVMKRAHAIRKETGASLSEALKAAWKAEKVADLEERIFLIKMSNRISQDEYRKMDAYRMQINALKTA